MYPFGPLKWLRTGKGVTGLRRVQGHGSTAILGEGQGHIVEDLKGNQDTTVFVRL